MITLFGQFYYASYIAPAQKAEKKAALAKSGSGGRREEKPPVRAKRRKPRCGC